MSKLIPPSRPQASWNDILAHTMAAGLDLDKEKVIIVGVRGYYKRTMGNPFKNDRNLYDDAVFILTGDRIAAFNCNVDPSKYQKGIAKLVPGIYKVVKWMHKGKYKALQITQDVVERDGQPGTDTGRHGINFHYGGDNDTWSLGCQTFPQTQYWQFQGLIYELMTNHKLKEVTYLLTEY